MLVESKLEYESTYVGAYLLLGDLEVAQVHYECMDKKEHESFRKIMISRQNGKEHILWKTR